MSTSLPSRQIPRNQSELGGTVSTQRLRCASADRRRDRAQSGVRQSRVALGLFIRHWPLPQLSLPLHTHLHLNIMTAPTLDSYDFAKEVDLEALFTDRKSVV